MNLKGSHILMVSPENWGKVRLSKHHFAMAAAELGARVFFLEAEGSAQKLEIRPSEIERISILSQGMQRKGLRFLPAAVRQSIERKHLEKIEALCAARFDILWNFDAFQFRYLSKKDRGERKHILHLLDYPPGGHISFQAQNADICIAVRKDIHELFIDSGATTPKLIPHSFAPREGIRVEESDLPSSSEFLVGYVGNLAIRFLDLEGLSRICLENPDVHLVLIGPRGDSNLSKAKTAETEEDWNKLIAMANCTWIGAVDWKAIPGLLDRMDGLLLAYDSKRFENEISSPHKLLEYFASGKEILSSYIKGLPKDQEELLLMMPKGVSIADGMADLKERIANSEAREQADRVRYAEERTYLKTCKQILNHLQV